MANTNRHDEGSKPPAQDEWGMYDPEKAGLSALFNRLDETPAKDEHDSGVKTRVLNLSGVRKPAPPVPGGRSML